MFDRRLITNFDWSLLLLTLVLAGIGVATVYSAVNASGPSSMSSLYLKQIFWFGCGMVVMVGTFLINYKKIEKWSPVIFVAAIILLLVVHFVGRKVGGSTRWLTLGPFTLQPSEPVKIAVVLILARYLAKHVRPGGLTFRELLVPVFLVGLPFMLVVTQPDLGTAGVIALIAATMTIFVKIERRTFLTLMTVGIAILPLTWYFLEPYQRMRIMMLFRPESDPLGAGYHVLQSEIAVGSGMMYGKGFLKGTQNILSFLPEHHTDFIFSVLAEEFGFTGSLLVLVLFLLLIAFGLNIAHGCRDSFGTIMAVGITSMFFWQVFINVGMVMGIMPVVGMPLPMISYGGSSVLTTLIGIGLLMNVSMRRFMKE